jgi:hypothetical protein
VTNLADYRADHTSRAASIARHPSSSVDHENHEHEHDVDDVDR